MPATVSPRAGGPGRDEAFRQLVHSIRDYAILSLDVHGNVATWNAGAERIKGYSADEIIGRHFSVFYTAQDVAAGKLEMELATATEQGRYEEDGWRVRKDGTQFWANVVITALRDDDGTLVGFGKVTRDITERHQQEQQLTQAAAELRSANDTLSRQAEELARARDVATMAVRRQEFGRRLTNALDMADGESEVIDVIERSFASLLPDAPVELLLADNSHAHLRRLATATPSAATPGCEVDAPYRCPAARRAQIQRFEHSEDLDACPKLRARAHGAVSALCVPVSIMGRTVGVIHTTAEPHTVIPDEKVADLGTLANLAGARIGLLRVMAETQLQANTDSLTGMLNRRSFEQSLTSIRAQTTALSLAMGDLDHFKTLNDTYGHETGDRALRLFAQVLNDSVRSNDLTCRHGGEEFVIALPECAPSAAHSLLEAVRERLAAAITVSGLPSFTVSFGVVETRGDHEDLPALLSRADAALFHAKKDGRDRVVVHNSDGNPIIYSDPSHLASNSRGRLSAAGIDARAASPI